jgi:hypothetical protein
MSLLREWFLRDDNVMSVAKRSYQGLRQYTDSKNMPVFGIWYRNVRQQMARFPLPDDDATDVDFDFDAAISISNVRFIKTIIADDHEFLVPERKEFITPNQFEDVWRHEINPFDASRVRPNVLKTRNLYRRHHDLADDTVHVNEDAEKETFQRGDRHHMERYIRTREQKSKYQSWGK